MLEGALLDGVPQGRLEVAGFLVGTEEPVEVGFGVPLGGSFEALGAGVPLSSALEDFLSSLCACNPLS